uniref:Uncharacterized protein n=1 Tax=Chromera velia CCMP2878 TaxID=1169474 RepID=A0A0G4GJ96_9ALVE|eukprot:Cvel_22151.t1-p1 / transcript=Cvel_22151.t1 / gene=Cvel_22151 / organism=Chromera_velia_CCMP2878 / gene_product=hypothetical protein / transcript_product=hypothetical protein / location=Cvel_scaffold2149:20616-21017(+) / protein_length=134 / sequence_SO=supercontig / SO=protein_coding / is_pseudo=false
MDPGTLTLFIITLGAVALLGVCIHQCSKQGKRAKAEKKAEKQEKKEIKKIIKQNIKEKKRDMHEKPLWEQQVDGRTGAPIWVNRMDGEVSRVPPADPFTIPNPEKFPQYAADMEAGQRQPLVAPPGFAGPPQYT